MPRIQFLGVGDATDFELGQTSLLYDGACRLLVDCGPQIPSRLVPYLGSADELDAIYITHCHADHCFGLSSLLLWMRQEGRRRPLALMAESSTLSQIRRLVELGYPGAFAPSKCFAIEECPLSEREPFEFRTTTLRIAATEHNLPNFALRIDDAGASCAFGGDGRPVAATVELYASVQLLVHECAFLDREPRNHTNVAALVELCSIVRPGRLATVHCVRKERAAIESRLAAELGDLVVSARPASSVSVAYR